MIARLADDDRRTEQKRQLNQRMRNRAAAQPAARGKKNNYWWIFLVLGLGASALRALPTKLSTNADSGVAPPAPVVKPMPRLEFKGRDKDGNQRLWVDGNEVVVDPNAPGRVFGKEPADRLLDSSKGKRDDTATDKKDPP